MKLTSRTKNLLFSAAVICAVILAVCFIAPRIETVEEHYQKASAGTSSTEENQIRVTLSISCTEVYEAASKASDQLLKSLPDDGIILPETVFTLPTGATVFDLLSQAAGTYRLQLEYEGEASSAFGSVYVEGIENLYELDAGPLSGWVYTVNRKTVDTGCNLYRLQDGDTVAWNYTLTGIPTVSDPQD